jgi:hypothetical protein
MFDVFFERPLEDNQWRLKSNYPSRPATMFYAVVLKRLDYNRLQRTDATLFPSALGPICQELRLPLVGQRVIE